MHDRRSIASVLMGLCFCLGSRYAISQDAIPPNPEPRWFKGNLHTHSLWSDGNDYPEMIAEWYRSHDYHFLAISDHNILSEGEKWIAVAEANKRGDIGGLKRYRERFGDDWVETREGPKGTEVRLKPLEEFRSLVEEPGRFLLISAEEITDSFQDIPIHVNATNLRDLIQPQGGKSVRETIENNFQAVERQSKRTRRPMLAHVNHPNFYYGITAEDLAAVVDERFFEVYNGHPEVHHQGDEKHASVERLWDIALTLRLGEMKAAPLFGIAVDDTHNYFGNRGASPGRGWIMVRAKHLTAESLLAAMKQGDFYASSGVTLRDVRFLAESGVLEIDIDAREGESYATQFIGTCKGYDPSHTPVTDEQGKPLRATQKYSDDIGRVLATVEGPSAHYKLTGDELYVRAVVTSNKPPENPAFEGQRQQAWTQPVGWEQAIGP